ncbi:MAG: DUF1028 domain-containing protein [Candidatus Dormibacteraeota bacterium]|nr:DUF1028 domain-containing protein [Candidatus Dormibacteraeota bacterium]
MTYSIVARDAVTGELGVAVQSHYFQVGPLVPWGAAGVGAVATQSRVNVGFGPLGLDLMRLGHTAPQALAAVLAADPEREVRQCAMVDSLGGVAAHTGSGCVPEAGHHVGEGYSVQGNVLEKASCWEAMARAYESAAGPLPERLLAALEAAEAEGGDVRGRQSAAMLVLAGQPSGRSWEDRTVDLRVEDHSQPLTELRRLLRVRRAYQAAATDDLAGYRRAVEIAPEMEELQFDAALAAAAAGEWQEAELGLRAALAVDPRWLEMMRRLVGAGRLDAAVADALIGRVGAGEGRVR